MVFKPATPGFLVTLVATILLAVVSFSVPLIKSVFFLQATVNLNGLNGTATFGVLGYCLDVGGTVNCTSPRVGYDFNPNALLGNKTPIQIPSVVVKWLTYALVLHIVALALAAGSALFGLLAHVREMSMACCSTCISGFGAAVALIAFIFDIAFFFLAKARINSIPGSSAQIGNAIWLTLAAWLLLFFAGCFYTFGRCCISNRPRGPRDKKVEPSTNDSPAEVMRLDAVKAEADRKARQKQGEMGLPAFNEYDPTKPLTAKYEEEEESYTDSRPSRRLSNYSGSQGTGYAFAPLGPDVSKTYHATPSGAPPGVVEAAAVTTYPPQPQAHTQQPPTQYNTYGNVANQPAHEQYPSTNVYGYNQPPLDNPYDASFGQSQYPPNGQGMPSYNQGQYASAESSYGQGQYAPAESSYGQGQYAPAESSYGQGQYLAPDQGAANPYSHHTQATSYYSTASHYPEPSHNIEASKSSSPPPRNFTGSPQRQTSPTQFLSSTTAPAALSMGRDDYTFTKNAQPLHASPPPMAIPPGSPRQTSGPRGPRSPTSPSAYSPSHSDMPPSYREGSPGAAWPNEKWQR